MGNCFSSDNTSVQTQAKTEENVANLLEESKATEIEVDPIIELLNAGLGVNSPVKMWVDSDCTSFDNLSDTSYPHARSAVDVDDGWALCGLINSPRINLVGISSSFGNDYEYWTYKSLEQLLAFAGKTDEIPLYHGATNQLASLSFGGYAPYQNPSKLLTYTNDAVEAMKNTLLSLVGDEKLYIYADGPCTNVAILLILYPELRSKIGFICVFMGRETVIEPAFQFGTKQKDNGIYFSDFNFDLDPLACQILLKQASVPVILVGGQLAKNSLIMHSSDIADLFNSTASGTLMNELATVTNTDYPLPHWLSIWGKFGYYLPPWPTTDAWNGFVPFGLMSASLFFYSELLNVEKVTPSMPFVHVKKLGTIVSNPSNNSGTNEDINELLKHSDIDNTDNEKKIEQEKNDINKLVINGDSKEQTLDLQFRGADNVSYFTLDRPFTNNEIINNNDPVVPILGASYFQYYLCTSPNSSAAQNAVVVDQPMSTLQNIYYVPSIRGETYPWTDYKVAVMNLLKQPQTFSKK